MHSINHKQYLAVDTHLYPTHSLHTNGQYNSHGTNDQYRPFHTQISLLHAQQYVQRILDNGKVGQTSTICHN